MKRIIFSVGILFFITVANAQTTTKPATKKQQSSNKKTTENKSTTTGKTITLTSINNYYALADDNTNKLQIWDPTIRALNANAKGANVPISESGIVGMPKRAYGIANGQIIFRPTDAVSSGSTTGSGAVGTGTSAGAMGRMAQSISVNGKNPYAGTGMWGTKATLIGANGRDAASRATSEVPD